MNIISAATLVTDRRLRAILRAAQMTIKPNGLRKAFISHRSALLGDLAKVADEAGTSVAKIKSNYLNRPAQDIGAAYFAITPPTNPVPK